MGIAYPNGFPGRQRANAVWHQAIRSKIPTANDISAPGRHHRTQSRIRLEERLPPGGNQHFAGRLTGRIDIMAAQRIRLAVAVNPVLIQVTFVGGHHDHVAGPSELPDGLQQIHGPEHVGLHGFHRSHVGAADQWLGGQMENELRTNPPHGRLDRSGIAHICRDFLLECPGLDQ